MVGNHTLAVGRRSLNARNAKKRKTENTESAIDAEDAGNRKAR
jgi:hypothetical protein